MTDFGPRPGGDEDLDGWIEGVKLRLAHGDLADLDSIPVGQGYPSLPGELFVRVVIADYEHYADLSLERRRQPQTIAQRLALLGDLRKLRAIIG